MCVCVCVYMGVCLYLATIEAQPWLLSVSEHLPQRDPKHPRVAGVGEGPGLQALRGTPAHHREEVRDRGTDRRRDGENTQGKETWLYGYVRESVE